MPLGKGTYDPTRFNAVYLAERFTKEWFGVTADPSGLQAFVDAFQRVLDIATAEGVIQ